MHFFKTEYVSYVKKWQCIYRAYHFLLSFVCKFKRFLHTTKYGFIPRFYFFNVQQKRLYNKKHCNLSYECIRKETNSVRSYRFLKMFNCIFHMPIYLHMCVLILCSLGLMAFITNKDFQYQYQLL